MQVKKQELEPNLEQQTGSKLGEEYIKAVYSHPAYLNLDEEYVMLNVRLDEAQVGIKIAGSKTSDMKMTPPLWQKAKKN